MPAFDNLADVQSKFLNTICYYEGNAVIVKNAAFADPANPQLLEFDLLIGSMNGGKNRVIKLSDPLFNYTNYNLGYAQGKVLAWWYRRPYKQYRQGLKGDQLMYRSTHDPYGGGMGFEANKSTRLMLENSYARLEDIIPRLHDEPNSAIPFHRDFAIRWDDVHRDYVYEYRGSTIAHTINKNLREFNFIPEYEYVKEALLEVTKDVA